MSNDYWSIERYRLAIVVGGGFLLAWLTPYPFPIMVLVLLGYIAWMLHKLYELQRWLTNGQKPEEMPDSDGAWEQIAYLFHKSQQKSAERKQKQKELLNRFDNVLSVLPDAAILLDIDNHIQWANKSAAKLLGIRDEVDRGKRIDTLLRNPDLHKLLEENSERKVTFPSPRHSNLTLRGRLLPLQGGSRVLSVRDISEGVQLQKTRKAFIANASHELRTPLTVLTGYIELFEQDPELPDYFQAPLQQSREQAARMQQIISDMLALSRLESQETTPLMGNQVDVPALLESGIQAIRDTLAANTHTLEAQIESDLCVCGSEKDIHSIITNLLANAVKHTPTGTRIRILWQSEADGQACLSIEDNGPGIPEKHLPHLTERFYRVDEGRSRASGGTGLGLAIVKHVMQWHNGKLTIESKPGRTVFRACFPAKRVLD
ncbi:MAG: phosphate regulon sensor histidine kinase PhoR [Pseudomonadota bacterium]|jgi:two-component system phosphate regulon sensor histidine kinase PhoR|uniref:Phosphate regulon sensor protein PhoR n=1 Tax=Thiothrix fructosivorans TaxID=111770 RepID=A0A8B0SE12_9GAMM|nr:phosphate regulon sensor histidine kinase PhoR [Thiothrix fructosivorans]MBO0614759.1 phosphate regulon sensor histidine kinase PhoR [Thiothrix fructosivorans]QTX09576.1 phosphate regulon sensor histidine kinase PhoR [Thiothrix fructosivorans]